MIFQIIESLELIAESAAIFLILLGVMWLVFGSYEANRRKGWRKLTGVDDWDFDITKILKILTFLGFIVGIVSLIIGFAGLILNVPPSKLYAVETGNYRNLFTCVFLIILGILTFMKPLNDLPIASIIGFLAGTAICVGLAFIIPDGAVEWIGGYINPKILLIAIFLIIFAIVAITVKFYTAGLMFISKIISFPVLALIIAAFCFLQGFSLLAYGVSIVG